MNRKMPITRPNRKVTEFFRKIPKTGPRPDQSVYDISSSSDRSIISISSGGASPMAALSQQASIAGSSTHVATQVAGSLRQPGGTRSAAVYVSSSPPPSVPLSSPGCVLLSSPEPSMTRGNTRSEGIPVVSKLPPKQRATVPSMPKNNAKKRKQPPISVISSEDSDGPVFPVILVRPSSRDNASPARRPYSHAHPSIDSVIISSSTLPLSPRHTTLNPCKGRFSKGDPMVLSPASQAKKSEHHQHSPRKRMRYNSLSMSDKRGASAPGDADDEREDEDGPTVPTQHNTQKTTPDIVDLCDDDHMHVDVPTASPARPAASYGVKACNEQPTRKATLGDDAQDTLPSSQQDEVELGVDCNVADINATNVPEHQSPVSPSKTRAEGIIARIKARAEAEATTAQPQIERMKSTGLLDTEGDLSELSSLSSLSSLSDEDDKELEFELGTYGKASGRGVTIVARSATSVRVSPQMLDGKGTRRSARNENIPAPNYAKKLELVRIDPLPSKDRVKPSANSEVKSRSIAVPSCPLDDLLRDHEREDARRAKAEKKRKGHPSMRDFSPVMPNMHSGVFHTPSRSDRRADMGSSGSDIPSDVDDNIVGDDTLMGDAEREELLGKEDADAVGKILAGDRVKNVQGEREVAVTFWDNVREGRKDVVPELVVSDESSPVFQLLRDKLRRGDYRAASLLINTGILTAASQSLQLLEWLFLTATSTANPAFTLAVYRALLVLQRERSGVCTEVRLSSKAILASLFKFGVSPQISVLLGAGASEKTPVVEADRDTKASSIYRFANLLEAFGRSDSVEPDAMPSIVLSLLLLALDPSASPELRQDIVNAIESLLSSSTISRVIELRICKSIVHATTALAFTPEQEAQLLTFLSGCGPSSGRVRRWTAWAMLGGDLSSVQESGDIPPLEVLANLFVDNPTGSGRFEVDRDTDYESLGARIEALSVALTDVDAYIRLERSAQGVSGGSIDGICKALESMNGKIVDTRAANLDRTRTKDAINRLHKRLLYQRHATLELIRGNAGKMDGFVTKKSSNTKSKPKPKPTMGGTVTALE